MSNLSTTRPQPTEGLAAFLARRSVARGLRQGATYLALIIVMTVCLLPMLYMVSTSLKPPGTETEFPIRWIPSRFVWDNYVRAATIVPMLTYLKNTLIIAGFSVVGNLLTASLAAYGFARLRFPGRDALFMLMLSTMMLPYMVVIIPLFVLFRELGWVDTLYPFTVPAFLGGRALYIFLLRQYFKGLPMELDEAAKIDGAGFFRIWWTILMPLARPALGTVAILCLVASWNDFVGPMIFLNSTENFTLALGTRAFHGQYTMELNLTMAFSTMMTLPILTVFFLFQKYMIKGISMTGITGR